MKTVLLTTAYGPYEKAWGTAPTDLLGARLARGHGIFNMTSYMPTWALYLIAENLKNPSTVLDFPNWEEFLGEVRRGYDVIAIELKSLHMKHVARMVRAVREISPRTEIVVGGYGVSTLDEYVPADKEGHAKYIREHAHHLCREEGVRYMRRLLGDEPAERPITQYHMPCSGFHLPGFPEVAVRSPGILVSLGCPSACEFCNTSAHFDHKKIYVAEPAQVYDFMKAHQRRLGAKALNFTLFDEDIFLNPEYVRELGRLIRSDKSTWGFRWVSFGSVRALSQFSGEELRECGVGGIWIGVESGICEDGKTKTGFAKRDGTKDVPALIDELHRYGVQVTASMILGLDIHTPENIEADIDYFVKLKPVFYQVTPLTPCPGTRLYDRMMEERRIYDDFDWKHFHIWKDEVFELKNFEDGAIRRYYDLAHEKLRTENGPPVVQFFEDNLLAYDTLKHSESEFLRFQAGLARQAANGMRPFLQTVEHHPPSEKVKQRVRELRSRADAILGGASFPSRVAQEVAGRLLDWRMDQQRPDSGASRSASKPPTTWAFYNKPGEREPLVREGSRGRPIPLADSERRLASGPFQIQPPKPGDVVRGWLGL